MDSMLACKVSWELRDKKNCSRETKFWMTRSHAVLDEPLECFAVHVQYPGFLFSTILPLFCRFRLNWKFNFAFSAKHSSRASAEQEQCQWHSTENNAHAKSNTHSAPNTHAHMRFKATNLMKKTRASATGERKWTKKENSDWTVDADESEILC